MPGLPPSPLPPADALRVERFRDPMTRWEMVGAGASWEAEPAAPGLTVELLYDGVLRVEDAVRTTVPGRYEFGLHAPREPDTRRVTVRLRGPGAATVLFDGEIAELPDRDAPARIETPPGPRWLSPVRTLGRGVISGEVFTGGWWSARARRYRDLALKARQRLRDRLLIRSRFRPRTVHDAYVERTRHTLDDLRSLAEQAGRFSHRPTISVLLPVHNVDPRWLREAVESVRRQAYPHWELCLADDASTNPATVAYLDRLPADPRIKLARRTTNGHICAATNSAADLATGDFVALLDHDDVLAPHALYAVARLLQDHPGADLIYSDEDKIDAAGHRYDPQFKPDWSPHLLLSYNYINHFTVVRRRVFEQVGRFREGFEGSQDHDLLLRVTEQTDRVFHIPEILYHWRSLPSSTASSAGVKGYVHTSGRRAVAEALQRRGIGANLSVPPFAAALGLPVLALDGPDDGPSVAVIVYGPADDAARTVRALKQSTAYRNRTEYLVLDPAGPADELNRVAAGRTDSLLLFLAAGLEPTDPRWLSRLVAHATLPEVGAVGGLIRDPDGAIVSAGTVLGTRPVDAFRGLKPDPVSYYFYAEVTRTVSAPARGCLLTPRAVFERVGGFDADRYGQSLFEVDYCLRASGLGYHSVHVGGAELRQPRPSPARSDAPGEIRSLRATRGAEVDPFYNPNLAEGGSFSPTPGAAHLIPAEPGEPLPVLFATHTLSAFEGAPKIIQDVAIGLTRRGVLSASAFAPGPGRAALSYRAAGIPLSADEAPFSKRYIDGQWSPVEYEAALRQLGEVIRRDRPRVVVANTLGMFPLVEAAARQGIPAILAIQESYPEDVFTRTFSPYGRWRCERAFAFADRVVFASHSCADLYRRLNSRQNFEVIHNGLSPGSFDSYRQRTSRAAAVTAMPADHRDQVRVVTVGTVCERKAQHMLVEAAARVTRTRRDFVCYLLGAREGLPYLSYVRNLIRARGLEDVVVVVPETDRVWDYLRSADVFVCPSYVEAFSLSVLEAGAFELPVVSTPCGGLDEQVFWGRSALRFDFGDAAGLADRLLELLADPTLRTAMGRQSRAAFELSLTADEMIDRYGRTILTAAGVRTLPARAVERPRALVA